MGSFFSFKTAFFVTAISLLSLIFLSNLDFSIWALNNKHKKETDTFNKMEVILCDPEQSPEGIHDNVMLGFKIILYTPELLPENVGNQLSCTNCHFSAGNTMGGLRGSIPLAGVAAMFPQCNNSAQEIMTLEDRINGCFKRSMNGKPLGVDSKEMKAIVTYIHWISKGFPIYKEFSWRGLKPLNSESKGNTQNGEKLYHVHCALCHGNEGQGGTGIPPIWGEGSFNDGAGMYQHDKLSSFIFYNMPYENVGLTEEEAIDIASYIVLQPRPKYEEE